MGKDRTSNILYGLGIIGGIMFLIGGAYILISGFVWAGTELLPIDRVLMASGSIIASFAYLGIYRDTESYIPIIPFLFFNLYQIIGMLLQPYLHLGYFTPAYLVNWSIMLIAFGFAGYSFYMTREKVGVVALIAGILFIIWAFLRIGVGYGVAVTEDLFFYQLRSVAETILGIVKLVYFILAIRTGPS
ncbi:MAG: hypothetical protein ACFFE2_08410 [Candidatus Thorarchaeota archaeon]